MTLAGKAEQQTLPPARGGRSISQAAMAVALGLVALMAGLGATMAGTWIAYWHGADLVSLAGAGPEPDLVSLYLVACGTVTTILGGLTIYRSQDM